MEKLHLAQQTEKRINALCFLQFIHVRSAAIASIKYIDCSPLEIDKLYSSMTDFDEPQRASSVTETCAASLRPN